MIKLIEPPKNQIRRICKLLAIFFICDYWNFRCLEFYQFCTLQYCSADSRTAVYIAHIHCASTRVMQVHLKEKQIFAQIPQAQYTENASARQKKNIAASTSVYIKMVNNQLLTKMY
jgi:hypothetical protein